MEKPKTLRPTLQALLLADHVYQDAATGKAVIAGVFHQINQQSFPSVFGRPVFAFVSLTNLRGSTGIQLRWVDNNLRILLETGELRIESEDPNATLQLTIEVPPFPLPQAGVYSFEVHADGDQLGRVRIVVQKIEPGNVQ